VDFEVVALIASEDYESFRRILHAHLPNTYDEWFQLHSKELANHERFLRPFREIQIYPDEFIDYLRPFGREANLVSMRNFAIEKSARHG